MPHFIAGTDLTMTFRGDTSNCIIDSPGEVSAESRLSTCDLSLLSSPFPYSLLSPSLSSEEYSSMLARTNVDKDIERIAGSPYKWKLSQMQRSLWIHSPPTNSVKKLCRSTERPAASYPLKLVPFLLFLSPFQTTFLWNSVRRSLESRPREGEDAVALAAQCYLMFPSNIDNIPWNDEASNWQNAEVLDAVKYKKRLRVTFRRFIFSPKSFLTRQ